MKKSIENQIIDIKKKIAQIGYMKPGSISKQYNVCGSVNCKCKDKKNPIKHGPYCYLSYTFKGKSCTEFIPINKIKNVKEYIKNYKLFKELSLKLVEKNIEFLKRSSDEKC